MIGPRKGLRDHIVYLPHFTNEAIKTKGLVHFSFKITARSDARSPNFQILPCDRITEGSPIICITRHLYKNTYKAKVFLKEK